MAKRLRSAPRRPQAERRAQSERRLLDAATQLIAEQGFSKTTLAQIGAKAGYSRGLVNERFGSKGELVRVLADEFQTYFQYDRLVPALEHQHGLEALLITIDTYLDSIVRSEHLGRAYYELLGESIGLVPEIHDTFVEADRLLRAAIERTILSAIRAGEIPGDVDSKAFAVFIVALLRGTVMQWLLDPTGFDLAAVRGVIRRTLESAFRAAPRAPRASRPTKSADAQRAEGERRPSGGPSEGLEPERERKASARARQDGRSSDG